VSIDWMLGRETGDHPLQQRVVDTEKPAARVRAVRVVSMPMLNELASTDRDVTVCPFSCVIPLMPENAMTAFVCSPWPGR
jgi:hypothetical protein